jgi:hypothetical protein
MSNVDRAVAALTYVKSRISLASSDNKGIRQDRLPSDAQSQNAHANQHLKRKDTLDKVRSHHRFPGAGKATAQNVVYYGAFALAAGAGNCLEMACGTVWYLNEQGRFDYDMVYYPGTNQKGQGVRDHIFVVIGQNSDNNGDFPSDFGAWGADAAICDVWADVACPARDYAARWRARMNDWNTNGVVIVNFPPTHNMWMNVVDLPKKSYLTAG